MFLVLEVPTTGAIKVSTITRCSAKGVDLFVVMLVSVVLPYPLGVLLGLGYTLIHDGLRKGQSLGKWIFNLKTIDLKKDTPCTMRESVIRNAPLGVAVFFGIIPFWGWIILVLLGIPLIILEVYLMTTLANGGRLGDVMADTKVIELPKKQKKSDKSA
jgi:uncharacterized RDD family membrane protein YckC